MSEQSIPYLTMLAEKAEQEQRWRDAQDLYQQILNQAPGHPKAERALHRAQQAIAKEAELEESIAAADALLAQGHYREARHKYPQLMEYAASAPQIARFLNRLEQSHSQAKELETWHEQVQRALQQVQQHNAKNDWDAAGKTADEMLRQLPLDKLYKPLVDQLEAARDTALQQEDHKSLYDKAVTVLREKDFDRGIELLMMIPEHSAVSKLAKNLLAQAKMQQGLLERDLAAVANALQEDRLTDALAELEATRSKHIDVVRWRRFYLQAGVRYGRAHLEEGRQRNAHRDFAGARQCFTAAKTAFEKVLELYPAHPEVQVLRDECVDVVTIAGFEERAQLDETNGQRSAALEAWKQAQQHLVYARGQGRDYATLRAVVETELNRLQEEIKRIRQEEQQLNRAKSLWESNYLNEAQQAYLETLDALLEEHRQQAAAGLSLVEAKIQAFNEALARGAGASDPAAAVQAYEKAYALWPSAPEVLQLLETTLIQASETALAAGRANEAVSYGNRAKELNPDSYAAKQCIQKAGLKPRIEVTLKQVDSNLATLQRQEEIQATDLIPLLSEVETLLQEASAWPELSQQLLETQDKLKTLRRQWQNYEQHYQRAVKQRDSGNWAAALAALNEGMTMLGERIPPGVQAMQGVWANMVEQVAHAEQEVTEILEMARSAYAEAATKTSIPDLGEALEPVLETLEPAHKQLERVREQAEAAGGSVTAPLGDLQKQLEELHARATVAREAAMTFSASDGLLKIQEAIKMRGKDATFEALQAQLRARVGEMLAGIKQQAQTAIQTGDLTEAEEKLLQVRELDPSDTETAQLYAGLRQRRLLEEKLRSIERDADSKLASHSPMDALKTLRQGLNAVLEPDVNLLPRAREILSDLVSLGDRDDGLALGQPENWQTAQNLTAELGGLRSENWVAGRIVPLLDQWIRLARDTALRGVVASAAQLGNLLEAYRAAAAYLKAHPQEPFAIQQLTERQESLINQLNESANKRLYRAQIALGEGEFAVVLHNLKDIEADFYAPVDKEFPGLLDGYDQVQAVRDEVVQLQAEAEKLQTLYAQIVPKLEDARLAYQQRDWDAAEKALEALPLLRLKEALPDLHAQIEVLQMQIALGRKSAARLQLQQVMSRIETGRNLAKTPDELATYLAELEALQETLNLQLLEVKERNRYFALLTELGTQRESLAAGVLWEAKIETHLQAENYVEALAALDEALAVTREAARRVDLKSRRNHIAKLAQAQEERETLFKQGQTLFVAGNYIEARAQFMLAKQNGLEVTEWLNAARAGALLLSAQRLWTVETDGLGALASLDEVKRLAEDNLYADEIQAEVGRLRRKIETALQGTSEINQALAEARRLLGAADLKGAQENIQKILTQNPKDSDALTLQAQIQAHTTAQNMLSEAHADQDAGRHKEALQRVLTILELVPTSPEARLLKQQLEAITQADQSIIEVEMLAKQAQFKEARARLTELSRQGVDPNKLRTTQKLIEDLEKEQWSKIIRPIEDDFRDGLYAEAWNRGKQALSRTATPDLLDELQHLQGLIVNRWAEKQAVEAREVLRQRPETDRLRALETQLEPFLSIEPTLEGHWQHQIESLLRETRTQRLRGRLEQARAQYAEWLAAERVGEPQGAFNILETVQKDIATLGPQIDFDVVLDATTLEEEIREAVRQRDAEAQESQRLHEAQARQNQRDRCFEAAFELRQKLEDPGYVMEKSPSRATLEQMSEHINQVFKISGYEQDAPARELREWTQNQLKTYDSTQAILTDVRALVSNHDFRGAYNALRRAGIVSPLLKSEHEHWRDIVNALYRADEAQKNEEWDKALQNYRQVLGHEASLETVLEKDIERCYLNLLKNTRETISQALRQTPPDTTTARAMLTQAENSGWIAAHNQRDYEQLRSWLISQEEVARAAELLQSESSELTEAHRALQKARQLLPRDQSDAPIHQWEVLVEALRLWQDYEQQPTLLPRVLQTFRDLQAPIADLTRVQYLRRQLEEETERRRMAEEEEAKRQRLTAAEAAERQDLLRQLTGQITAALSHPQDYVGAVRALENSSSKITGDAQFAALCSKVQEDMRTAMETAIQEWHYAQALEWAEILKRLPRLDSTTHDWAIGLPSDQRDALNAKLQEANAALEAHDEPRVLAALKDAEKIAAPHGDARIAELYEQLELDKLEAAFHRTEQALERYAPGEAESALKTAQQIPGGKVDKRFEEFNQRLNMLRRLLDSVHAGLREINILIGQNQWKSATERLLEVRNDAPRYDRVLSAMADLQDRLATQAEVERKTGKFAQGLALCELSQRLGPRDDVRTLQDQIRGDQETAVADLREQVRTGLDAWRLDPLSGLLTRGLQIAPNDDDLVKLNKRYQSLDAALPAIREQMERGWEQLQKRDHTEAIAAFERAFTSAPQPLPEAHLWRDYTRALREAAKLAEESTDFAQVARLLGEAAASMSVTTGQRLPDIFSGTHHLEERHRHASYNAWRLRQAGRNMDVWYRASDEYYACGDSKSMEEGMRLFDLVVKEREAFKRSYLNPTAPPDNFPLTGAADEPLPVVARPASSTSKTEATKNVSTKPDMPSAPSGTSTSSPSTPRKPETRSVSPPDTTVAPVVRTESDLASTEDTVPAANGKKKDNLLGKLFRREPPPKDTSDDDDEELDRLSLTRLKPKTDSEAVQSEPTDISTRSVTGSASSKPTLRTSGTEVPAPKPIPADAVITEAATPEEATEDYVTDLDGLGDFFKNTSIYSQDTGDGK